MGTINVKSNLTGKVYPILIAGNTPTPSEDEYIQNYISGQDGTLIETPIEDKEDGSLIDLPKGIVGGFAQSFAQIPGGIASLGESVGEKLGFDVAPGESDIGRAAQEFSREASKSIADTFDLNDSAYSKAGQAFGSLASFFVPTPSDTALCGAIASDIPIIPVCGTPAEATTSSATVGCCCACLASKSPLTLLRLFSSDKTRN